MWMTMRGQCSEQVPCRVLENRLQYILLTAWCASVQNQKRRRTHCYEPFSTFALSYVYLNILMRPERPLRTMFSFSKSAERAAATWKFPSVEWSTCTNAVVKMGFLAKVFNEIRRRSRLKWEVHFGVVQVFRAEILWLMRRIGYRIDDSIRACVTRLRRTQTLCRLEVLVLGVCISVECARHTPEIGNARSATSESPTTHNEFSYQKANKCRHSRVYSADWLTAADWTDGNEWMNERWLTQWAAGMTHIIM